MKTFHLTVAKVGETVFVGEAVSASLPGKEGVFQILAGHEALVSELVRGEMRIKTSDGQTHSFEIPNGCIAEVSHDQATVLF